MAMPFFRVCHRARGGGGREQSALPRGRILKASAEGGAERLANLRQIVIMVDIADPIYGYGDCGEGGVS